MNRCINKQHHHHEDNVSMCQCYWLKSMISWCQILPVLPPTVVFCLLLYNIIIVFLIDGPHMEKCFVFKRLIHCHFMPNINQWCYKGDKRQDFCQGLCITTCNTFDLYTAMYSLIRSVSWMVLYRISAIMLLTSCPW